MTQQNAALVEEAAAASESMDEESRALIELMQFFNVGEGSSYGASAPAERRSAERPWSSSASAKPTVKAAPAAAARVASGGGRGDDVWEEF
jgi:methyl-accepting chemotaxis protein